VLYQSSALWCPQYQPRHR